MRLAILGFGLIGGSIARALADRRHGAWHVTAWSRDPTAPRRALAEGVLRAAAPDPGTAVRDAELVVLAAPPLANLALVDRVAPLLADGSATLSDVSSVQGPIAERAARHDGVRFVGGHPMSGRERAGYGAATADLFLDRPWVVLPGPAAGETDVARVRTLAEACGARPVVLDPQSHDEAVGAISHLPLLTSLALAETVTSSEAWPAARRLAAQGWRDTTRLARGDAALGAGILAANAHAVAAWLRRYRERLEGWQDELDRAANGEPETAATALEPRLAAVAAALGDGR